MERDRFWIIAGILFLMFLIFMGIVVWKADSLTHNACEICAKKMGQAVVCTTGGQFGQPIYRTYLPNYTTIDNSGVDS